MKLNSFCYQVYLEKIIKKYLAKFILFIKKKFIKHLNILNVDYLDILVTNIEKLKYKLDYK